MSEEKDLQYKNDLELMKIQLNERISPEWVIKRMTNQFRADDDHVYAIHINRSASEDRNFFYRDIVKCDTLFASGHRLCFKSLRDMRDFLSFYDARFEQERKRTEEYCNSSYPIDKKEKLAADLKAVMDPVFEERLTVLEFEDAEVASITRHLNFADKE